MGDEDAAANRPPNCRLFLGNLASEKTSRAELMEIFGKYGNIIEEIIMRRSFGFIQYDSPEAALAALQHEQGRSIGGLRVGIYIRSGSQQHPSNFVARSFVCEVLIEFRCVVCCSHLPRRH